MTLLTWLTDRCQEFFFPLLSPFFPLYFPPFWRLLDFWMGEKAPRRSANTTLCIAIISLHLWAFIHFLPLWLSSCRWASWQQPAPTMTPRGRLRLPGGRPLTTQSLRGQPRHACSCLRRSLPPRSCMRLGRRRCSPHLARLPRGPFTSPCPRPCPEASVPVQPAHAHRFFCDAALRPSARARPRGG